MHNVLRICSGPSVLKCNFYYYLVMGRSTDQEMIGVKRKSVTDPKGAGACLAHRATWGNTRVS